MSLYTVKIRLVGAQSCSQSATISAACRSLFEYASSVVSSSARCLRTNLGCHKKINGQFNDKQLLKQTLQKQGVAAIFLTKPSGFFYTNTDALEYLVDLQSNMETSIQLLPVAVVWQRKPSKERSDLMRFILGSEDQPGPLMKLFSVVQSRS